MTLNTRCVLSIAAIALAAAAAACGRDSTSRERAPKPIAAADARPAGAEATPQVAAEAPEAASAETLHAQMPRAAVGPVSAAAFSGAPEDIRTLIGYHNTIRLSPEQERLKAEALSALPAPCCSRYSLATCCCPCNMAKAAWGLAAWLIAEKGYGAEQVRQAEADWLKRVNPTGFTGDSCFSGGCSRPMRENGCGGMKQDAIVS
jgi:hypothetical protein